MARHFDVTVGAITAREHVDDELTEDPALTEFLTSAWLDLISTRSTPVPRCPRCDGDRIRAERASGHALPHYFCHTCKSGFNRLTGTPFARLVGREKGTAMIPLLSRQMSLLQARKRLGRTQKAMLTWLLAFRKYLLELDPTGRWEAKVRLGVRIAPQAQCLRCGFEGGFLSGGFDPQRRRRIRCPQCGRSRLLDVLQEEGQAYKGVVMHDAIDTAVRQRRKYFPKAKSPPVARAAQVAEAMPTVQPRRLLHDVALPKRTLVYGPPDCHEDGELTAYLLEKVDTALSQDSIAGPCPWCESAQTEHHLIKRPSGLPGFKCRGCLGYFMRVTNTPLVQPAMRELARRFVPMLGWRNTVDVAAQALGVDASVVREWVPTWRKWLLLLDPSGTMEPRVRLDMPVAEPAALRRRAVKRRGWLSRAWLKRADGFSYLSADGYVVRVGQRETDWCFEIRPTSAAELICAGDGFAISQDARLAAFDAITDLLAAEFLST
ncbi:MULTISPECIES: DUF746 domain-containing protein [Ralstonia]|nr:MULTISPECIES: DUF746 domain-containing protein [Ralstonia]